MKKMKTKYKEIVRYFVCGVQTTIVNLISFWLFTEIVNLSTMLSTIFAWFFAASFAYYVNKTFVFESKRNTFCDLLKESVSFFEVRILSGIFETAAMVLLIDYFHAPKMWMKLLIGIVVTVANYIVSKMYIFQKIQIEERRCS